MATKPDDEIKGWFPTGYEHLESWVTDAQEKIAAIDLAIGNLLSDKGPFPSPRPSDEIPRLTPQGRQSIIVGYNQQKLKLKEELREKIKDATKGADPKTGKIISDKAEFLIDEKAMFNKMSKEKLAGISGEEKNNGAELEYIPALHFMNQNQPPSTDDQEKKHLPVSIDMIPDPLEYFNDILESQHQFDSNGYDKEIIAREFAENRDDIERGDD